MKDEYNRLDPVRQPGPLAELLGGQVEQYYALDETVPVGDGTATIWAERLAATAPDTQTVLTYGTSNGWVDGRPAVNRRRAGRGPITQRRDGVQGTGVSVRVALGGARSITKKLQPTTKS